MAKLICQSGKFAPCSQKVPLAMKLINMQIFAYTNLSVKSVFMRKLGFTLKWQGMPDGAINSAAAVAAVCSMKFANFPLASTKI